MVPASPRLLEGYISKDDAKLALEGNSPGTFLFRFSSKVHKIQGNPGKEMVPLVVSYLSQKNAVYSSTVAVDISKDKIRSYYNKEEFMQNPEKKISYPSIDRLVLDYTSLQTLYCISDLYHLRPKEEAFVMSSYNTAKTLEDEDYRHMNKVNERDTEIDHLFSRISLLENETNNLKVENEKLKIELQMYGALFEGPSSSHPPSPSSFPSPVSTPPSMQYLSHHNNNPIPSSSRQLEGHKNSQPIPSSARAHPLSNNQAFHAPQLVQVKQQPLHSPNQHMFSRQPQQSGIPNHTSHFTGSESPPESYYTTIPTNLSSSSMPRHTSTSSRPSTTSYPGHQQQQQQQQQEYWQNSNGHIPAGGAGYPVNRQHHHQQQQQQQLPVGVHAEQYLPPPRSPELNDFFNSFVN